MLGLSTGLSCAGFCVPLVGPILLAREKNGVRQSAAAIGLFLVGRLVAYLLFGLAVGTLGGALSGIAAVKTILLPVLYGVLGILMVVFGVMQYFPHVGFCRMVHPKLQSNWYLMLVGFLAGISLCPPFLLALTSAFGLGGALRGMLFFLVFFVATSVYLIPLLLAGAVTGFKAVRMVARILAMVAGVYFIALAVRSLVR